MITYIHTPRRGNSIARTQLLCHFFFSFLFFLGKIETDEHALHNAYKAKGYDLEITFHQNMTWRHARRTNHIHMVLYYILDYVIKLINFFDIAFSFFIFIFLAEKKKMISVSSVVVEDACSITESYYMITTR